MKEIVDWQFLRGLYILDIQTGKNEKTIAITAQTHIQFLTTISTPSIKRRMAAFIWERFPDSAGMTRKVTLSEHWNLLSHIFYLRYG